MSGSNYCGDSQSLVTIPLSHTCTCRMGGIHSVLPWTHFASCTCIYFECSHIVRRCLGDILRWFHKVWWVHWGPILSGWSPKLVGRWTALRCVYRYRTHQIGAYVVYSRGHTKPRIKLQLFTYCSQMFGPYSRQFQQLWWTSIVRMVAYTLGYKIKLELLLYNPIYIG